MIHIGRSHLCSLFPRSSTRLHYCFSDQESLNETNKMDIYVTWMFNVLRWTVVLRPKINHSPLYICVFEFQTKCQEHMLISMPIVVPHVCVDVRSQPDGVRRRRGLELGGDQRLDAHTGTEELNTNTWNARQSLVLLGTSSFSVVVQPNM
jgi:hypothetical protein